MGKHWAARSLQGLVLTAGKTAHLSEPIDVHVRQGHAQSAAQFPHVVDETLVPINPTAFLEERLAEKSCEYCGCQVRFCWEVHVD